MAGVRTEQASRSALPVFSVDTPGQAAEAIGTFGLLRFDGSYRWTGWPLELHQRDVLRCIREMDLVTRTLGEWWQERFANRQPGAASGV